MTPIPLGILDFPTGGGGFDWLETQTITSSVTSLTFSNLDTLASGYKHLQIRFTGKTQNGSQFLRCNNDNSTNYWWHEFYGNNTNVVSSNSSATYAKIANRVGDNQGGAMVLEILDFSNPNKKSVFRSFTGAADSFQRFAAAHGGMWNNTAAITTLQIVSDGNLLTGAKYAIYGVA